MLAAVDEFHVFQSELTNAMVMLKRASLTRSGVIVINSKGRDEAVAREEEE